MSRLDFRKDTEKKLWIFFFALCAFLLIVMIWGAIENAMGITIQTHETGIIDGYGINQPSRDCARGSDNIIRHAYPTTDLAVNLSYSSNNGTTWTEITILSAAYQGSTIVEVRGIVVSGNNTTAVLVRTVDADNKYDLYLLVRWAWVGSWVNYHVAGHATLDYNRPQMALNNTNIILILCAYNSNYISWYLFNLDNLDQNPNYGSAPTTWLSPAWSEQAYDFQPWVNTTGKFWIGWSDFHTYTYINARDFCATKSLIAKNTQDGVSSYNINAIQVVPTTGEAIYLLGVNYTALGNAYIYMYYLREGKTYFQGPGLLQSFTTEKIFENNLGMGLDATGMTYVFWYSGTNHKLRGMMNYYWETGTEWTASAYDVNTGYTSTDYINCGNGLGSLWPQVNGVPVNTPKVGYFMSWIWKDELGATDDYNYQVAFNTVTWPYIFWVPPVITNYSLPNWYESEPYLHDFSISSGNTPYVWWITWNDPSDGGWFLGDSNGTMYGYCPATNGTYSITVHVTDFYGLTTTRTTSLTILSRTAGTGSGSVSTPWVWPTLNEEADLWFVLAAISMAACIIGTVRNLSNRGRKRLEKLQRK